MKSIRNIVVLLALLLGCRLMAADDASRHEEFTASQPSGNYIYNIYNMVDEQDDFDGEFQSMDDNRKVGAPVPGMMLSILMAGSLARLLLRLKRRAERKIALSVSRILSALKVEECKKFMYNVLNIYATGKNDCCLKWQRVELRL